MDIMRYKFDFLWKGFMTIVDYEVYFNVLSRYFYVSISIESIKIQMFVNGLDIFLKFATSQIVIFGEFF